MSEPTPSLSRPHVVKKTLQPDGNTLVELSDGDAFLMGPMPKGCVIPILYERPTGAVDKL